MTTLVLFSFIETLDILVHGHVGRVANFCKSTKVYLIKFQLEGKNALLAHVLENEDPFYPFIMFYYIY